MSERRQHLRRRTLLDGRLQIAKLNNWSLDCSVRNLSAGGARVTIPGDVVVPQHVALAVSGKPEQPARLVWYREGHAGFALIDERSEDGRQAFAGPCRRESSKVGEAAPRDRLAARVAAIAAGRPQVHFTRP